MDDSMKKRRAAEANKQNSLQNKYRAEREKGIAMGGDITDKQKKQISSNKKAMQGGPLSWSNFAKAYQSEKGDLKGKEQWASARDKFYEWRKKRGSAVKHGMYSRND